MAIYRITVQGRLTSRLAPAFEGMALEPVNGCTVLVGDLDQAQLYGVIDRLRDLGIVLQRLEEGRS